MQIVALGPGARAVLDSNSSLGVLVCAHLLVGVGGPWEDFCWACHCVIMARRGARLSSLVRDLK